MNLLAAVTDRCYWKVNVPEKFYLYYNIFVEICPLTAHLFYVDGEADMGKKRLCLLYVWNGPKLLTWFSNLLGLQMCVRKSVSV
jgi:hypothetical protein